jgi:hypothetical protein
MASDLEKAFAQHGITVESSDGGVRVPRDEAYELLGYLELMHNELYKRGLCANGSPTLPGDAVAPLKVDLT